MLKQIKWAYNVLVSKSFLVATDKAAACYIPTKDPETVEDILELQAQEAALVHFGERIEELIRQHSEVVQLMERRARAQAEKEGE